MCLRVSNVSCRFMLISIYFFVSNLCYYSSLFISIFIISKSPFFFQASSFPFLHKRRRKRKTYCLHTFSLLIPFLNGFLIFFEQFCRRRRARKIIFFFKIYCTLLVQNAPLFRSFSFSYFQNILSNWCYFSIYPLVEFLL